LGALTLPVDLVFYFAEYKTTFKAKCDFRFAGLISARFLHEVLGGLDGGLNAFVK